MRTEFNGPIGAHFDSLWYEFKEDLRAVRDFLQVLPVVNGAYDAVLERVKGEVDPETDMGDVHWQASRDLRIDP